MTHDPMTDRYLTNLRQHGLTAEVIPTGGNCTAIEVADPSRPGFTFLVTDGEDACVPDTQDCLIGGYDADHEPLDLYVVSTVDSVGADIKAAHV